MAGGADRSLEVWRDLREWWLQRGVDYWTDDPTDRSGEGWVRVDAFGDDPQRLRSFVDAYGERISVDDTKAAAALLAKRLSSMLAFPPTVAWMRWNRVPRVTPETAWVRFNENVPDRVAVEAPRMWVLADDDAAGADDVDVVDEDGLLEALATSSFDETMSSVIDPINAVIRTGSRHLWGNLALVAINSALWAGDSHDPWGKGARLLAARAPLARTLDAEPAQRADTGSFLVALRKTCCLAYENVEHGYCASCSLLDRDERLVDLTRRIGDQWRDRPR
ncbi:MAG: (2Fe-2S)-binding protein [Actinomycetota bacterium]